MRTYRSQQQSLYFPKQHKLGFANTYESFDVIGNTGIFLFLSKSNHTFFYRSPNNKFIRIYDERYKKINNIHRERTHTTANNDDYTIVAVNQVDKNSKETTDSIPHKAELYMYRNCPPSNIHLCQHISEQTCKLNLNTNIFIIESCKADKEIFASGDSEG